MAAFFKALAEVCRRERLDEDTPPARGTGSGFFTWLFGAEELPKAAVSVPPEREGFFTWLLKPDPLPAPEGGTGERAPSVFSVIFGRDDLSRVPDGAPEERDSRKNVPDGNTAAKGAGKR
jgi:hypothetical protein